MKMATANLSELATACANAFGLSWGLRYCRSSHTWVEGLALGSRADTVRICVSFTVGICLGSVYPHRNSPFTLLPSMWCSSKCALASNCMMIPLASRQHRCMLPCSDARVHDPHGPIRAQYTTLVSTCKFWIVLCRTTSSCNRSRRCTRRRGCGTAPTSRACCRPITATTPTASSTTLSLGRFVANCANQPTFSLFPACNTVVRWQTILAVAGG